MARDRHVPDGSTNRVHEGHLPAPRTTDGWSAPSSPRAWRPSRCCTAPRRSCPSWPAQFDVSPASSTLTVSLTTLGLGVALLVAGPLSDVVGRTRLIHLSLARLGRRRRRRARSPQWSALLALRLLEGVALAGLPAVATAYLREELHPSVPRPRRRASTSAAPPWAGWPAGW